MSRRRIRLSQTLAARIRMFRLAGAIAGAASLLAGAAHAAGECPNGGVVRFGVEPFGASPQMLPAYTDIARLIGQRLGCKVQLFLVTSYSAEIEAMRSHRLEFGQFGPLGYVMAHKVAHAEAVAAFADADGKPATYSTSIVTWTGSAVHRLADTRGRSFAYTDPVSTAGHLYPAQGLHESGVDPDHGVRAIYTGSPTASFEALRNHKVDAAALSNLEIANAKLHGLYPDGAYVTLWRSSAIPTDPLAVRGDLPADFKARLTRVLASLDLRQLPRADQQFLAADSKPGLKTLPQTDAAFDGVRALLPALHIDLARL